MIAGRLKTASGALGGFRLHIDALRQIEPGGRGGFALSAPRDGAETECDVVLDLSGNPPLFPAPGKREGYLRADPGDPNAVAAAVFEAGQTVGTFEKPLYVRLEESLCAHSRAGKTGCTKCLDACPTGAIAPDGDHVAIDAMICAGCGTCSTLCPSSAITYDAPPTAALFKRIETLATVYREAGGAAPRLLVTDNGFGAEMIALSARFGRGLPADVIPLELDTLSQFGHAEMLAALGTGFAAVDILLSPRSERDLLDRELGLAAAMGGGGRLRLLDVADPDALSEVLYDTPADPPIADPVLPLGSRRQVARLAAKALNPGQRRRPAVARWRAIWRRTDRRRGLYPVPRLRLALSARSARRQSGSAAASLPGRCLPAVRSLQAGVSRERGHTRAAPGPVGRRIGARDPQRGGALRVRRVR